MPSIVIAAHNESAVIGRCLDAILADTDPGEFDIVVAANGCTDDTAAIAAARPTVRVLDLPDAGKARALNEAERVVNTFPRVYLDADIVLAGAALRRLVDALADASSDGVLAVAPRRVPDIRGRPLPVKGYFAVSRRLPAFQNALIGRGVIVLSEQGRSRFEQFPDLMADDLFLDSLFTEQERRQVDQVDSPVATPLRTGDLVRRLARVRRANAALRSSVTDGDAGRGVRQPARWSWLTDVVLPHPWLAPAGACYFVISILSAVQARRGDASTWDRDESTRTGPAPVRDRSGPGRG